MSDLTPSNPPHLSERERIQALLDTGRISQADAELLFSALDDEEALEESFGADGNEAQGLAVTEMDTVRESAADNTLANPADGLDGAAHDLAPSPPEPPEPPTPVVPLPPPPPEAPWGAVGPGSASQEGAFKEGTSAEETGVKHWVKLTGGCGDLLVTVDANLEGLAFTGEGEVERHGQDYHLRTPFDWKGGNWSKLRKAVGSLEVRLPKGYGLELGVFAGDGTIRGVRALRGKFTGGDLTVEGAEHLDLNVTSGDVTLKVRPLRGQQRLQATSGDVTLTFLAGSDVTVSGKATAGDIDVPQSFSRSRGFGTAEITGILGAGRARLELRLTAGNVDIRAEETRGNG